MLDSLIELATRELDDVSAFVLKCSLDEDRWVKPSQFLKRIAQLTKWKTVVRMEQALGGSDQAVPQASCLHQATWGSATY